MGKAAVAGFRGAKRSHLRSHRGKGDGMSAEEIDATREILAVRVRNLQPDTREG